MDPESDGGSCGGRFCRHCKARKISRPRRLCFNCYYNISVRNSYPAASKGTSSRGLGLSNAEPPVCPTPTTAFRGTEEKIRVMAARAAAGFSLFHPLDGPTGGNE